MSAGSVVGSLLSISRFPVKSMQGESLEQAEVGTGGVLGDPTSFLNLRWKNSVTSSWVKSSSLAMAVASIRFAGRRGVCGRPLSRAMF